MKNYTAPRTLADCEFRVGYHRASITEPGLIDNPWFFAFLVAVIGIIGLVVSR